MPKHTQKFLSKAGDDTQGLACSGVTRTHSRTIRHLLDLGATSLKERLSLFLAKNTYIPCIIIRETRRADGRTLHRSLHLRFFSFETCLHFLINTFSGYFSIWVIIMSSGMVSGLLEGIKLDARRGLFTQISPLHILVEGGFLIRGHTRGACQSLEVCHHLPALGL